MQTRKTVQWVALEGNEPALSVHVRVEEVLENSASCSLCGILIILLLHGQLHTLGKSSICIHRFKVVNLSMIRFVYFKLNKNTKEIDVIITYACFGIILVEISPAGAFLRRVFMGGVDMKNSSLDALFCQI